MPGLVPYLKKLRSGFRLLRTALHLFWAVLSALCVFPLASTGLRRKLKGRWSRQLFAMLGVRVRLAGSPPRSGLLVANHISWLDIYAINAMVPTNFVAKSDVLRWPLIGWLSRQAETIFLDRGSRTAVMRAKEQLVSELRQGSCIGVFPEGTTTRGRGVLPFHSALFQSAIDAAVPVTPIVIRYTDGQGQPSTLPAYVDETTLWQCLLSIVGSGGLTAWVVFMPAVDAAGWERRSLAQHTHGMVDRHLAKLAASSTPGPKPKPSAKLRKESLPKTRASSVAL